jgi:nuclear pore complex protein Nup155
VQSTWTNLIEQIHTGELAKIEQEQDFVNPYQLVAEEVREIGRRVNLSENVFPIAVLLQLLLKYHVEFYGPNANPTGGRGNVFRAVARAEDAPELIAPSEWVIDTFISLQAPFETIIATLESIWFAQEYPFSSTRSRKMLVKWIIYTSEKWAEQSRRQGNELFGGLENAVGLAECLRNVLSDGLLDAPGGDRDDKEWAERGRIVRDLVEEEIR